MKIKKIYLEVLEESVYDEEYGNNLTKIEGKNHGVCIDFCKILLKKLKEYGYRALLISTPIKDSTKRHAAILYEEKNTRKLWIMDITKDLKENTKSSYKIGIKEYLKENELVTIHNPKTKKSLKNLKERKEIERGFWDISKNLEK